MSFIESIILGIIQGLTEFLPISSSGHLEIANKILNKNIGEENLLMTVILHGATALSTIYIFRKDIITLFKGLFLFKRNEEFLFSLKIIISMIPAAFVGIFWEEKIESLFKGNLILVGIMLIVTAIILFLAGKAKSTTKNVSFIKSIIIGIAQAIAILPGISRSGATISISVLLGVDKEKSARFSFLMVVPLILGKMIKDILSGKIIFSSTDSLPLVAGFITALIIGLFACKWMITIVKNSNLKYFSIYCFLIGLICIINYL